MAFCRACLDLDQQMKRVQPHPRLALTHRSDGGGVGSFETYTCQDCGSVMTRDNDTKNPGAGWTLDRQPN